MVQIGIFRLAGIDDGMGERTAEISFHFFGDNSARVIP